MANPSLLILPGDGIGPEVMAEVRRVIDWFGANKGLTFDVSEDLVGGAAYDKHGTPLTDETMARAQKVDAVLLGAVGGPSCPPAYISANRAASTRKATSGSASIRSGILNRRSPAWPARRSNWRASGRTRSVRWKKPT